MLDATCLKDSISKHLPLTGLMLDATCLKDSIAMHLPLTCPTCVALFGVSLTPGAVAAAQIPQHAREAGSAVGPQVLGAQCAQESDAGKGNGSETCL